MTDQLKQDLLTTMRVIEGRGWVRGYFSTLSGVCLDGACRIATRKTPERYRMLLDAIVITLHGVRPDYVDTSARIVREWNDYSANDITQVIRLLQTTLKRIELEGR